MHIDNINKNFEGKIILKDAAITLPDSGILLIVGKNGIGKTTLVKILTGFIHNDTALKFNPNSSILLNSDLPWLIHNTGIQNLKLYLNLNGQKTNLEKVKILSRKLEFQSYLDIPVYQYSTGTIEKLMLMILFLTNKKYIFLDEPFMTLDISIRDRVLQLIKEKDFLDKHTLIIITNSTEIIYTLSRDTRISIAIVKNKKITNYSAENMTFDEIKKRIGDILDD